MQWFSVSVFGIAAMIQIVSARFRAIYPPEEISQCLEEKRFHINTTDPRWDCSHSWCIQKFRWHISKRLWHNISSETNQWVDELLRMTEGDRRKRQVEPLRVRQEYRRLTDTQRRNYHRAIQMLKADSSIYPNRYDALANLHQKLGDDIHHGAAFLGWHRVMLIIYENALRQKVPTVILPYWDSRMDERLTNPSLSVMWTGEFVGNGFGRVANGPFAYWQTPSGPLVRNLGQEGQLLSNRETQAILSRVRMSDITEPHAQPPFDFEIRHGEVHKWVGGIMAPAEHSAFDPIFFLHHAFVDYLWELFRVNQRRAGVDPTKDYPRRFGPASQSPTSKMGFGKLNMIHGLSDIYTSQIYTYENSPTCTYRQTTCGSKYLRCEVRFGSPNCVSVTAAESQAFGNGSPSRMSTSRSRSTSVSGNNHRTRSMPRNGSGSRQRGGQMNTNMVQSRGRQMPPVGPQSHGRQQPSGGSQSRGRPMPPNMWPRQSASQQGPQNPNNRQMPPFPPNFFGNRAKRSLGNGAEKHIQAFRSMGEICPVKEPPHALQNIFEMNGLTDSRVWVYVPIQIVYKRNPQLQKFHVFPIRNSKMVDKVDLYDPTQYASLKDYFKPRKEREAVHCKQERKHSVFMKIMVHSNGLNYHGTYRDFALLDARQPFSSSIVYIAVKSPEKHLTEVLFTTYDECGRVCQPYCKKSGRFVPCSGAMQITSSPPKMYGTDYGDAVRLVWDISGGFPVLNHDRISVRFLC
ncbi:uncharacterized protein LOC132544232 [Ylistrum balloti]|uniref:uncharacterized protein LOC132544232 n=1 Tax=Ylistrum balloti TaxID=509963 RepID=UPI002905BAFA|nr:uncharacterized protein LOC132544232 [Ylistrum balloti]